jgi:hypothetical protein
MLDKHIKAVSLFNPFPKGVAAGLKPEDIKAGIIELLTPYIRDHDLLAKYAVAHFANEAINVGYICSQSDWKALFECVIATRETATARNRPAAFQCFNHFDDEIREAQKKYSMLVAFEQPKQELGVREFAHEAFRTLGPLIESTIQPFLKEFLCFALITNGGTPNLTEIDSIDLGTTCQRLERVFSNSGLISPAPWRIRLNQWRNVAQHLNYETTDDKIVINYGKHSSAKTVLLTKGELLSAMREIGRRLSILKGARELYSLNYVSELNRNEPKPEADLYQISTEMGAEFGTQGFELSDLCAKETEITARFIDVAPTLNDGRHWHCSQFLFPISLRFPDKDVTVIYSRNDAPLQFIFSAKAEVLRQAAADEDPLSVLVNKMSIRKVS